MGMGMGMGIIASLNHDTLAWRRSLLAIPSIKGPNILVEVAQPHDYPSAIPCHSGSSPTPPNSSAALAMLTQQDAYGTDTVVEPHSTPTATRFTQKWLNNRRMKKAFILVAGGGFQWESLTLASQLRGYWECTYIVPATSVYARSALLISIKGSHYLALPDITVRANSNVITTFVNFLRSFRLLWPELKREQPDVVVCLGSSMSLPLAVVSRLQAVPIIFIESITRTASISNTGKLLLQLRLATRFFVQWPEQERLHPRVRYRGTVL